VGATSESGVAIVYDWNCRWALSVSAGPGNFYPGDKHYHHEAFKMYQALWQRSVPTDIISPDSDLLRYRFIILPCQYLIHESFTLRLRAFVEKGGCVLATFRTGMVDDTARVHQGGLPGYGLRKLFGLKVTDLDTLHEDESQSLIWGERTFKAGPYCELIELQGAQSMAHYDKEFYAGTPALTLNSFGSGQAWWLGCELDSEGITHLIDTICNQINLCGLLPHNQVRGVHAAKRWTEKEEFLFIFNHSNTPQKVTLDGSTWFYHEDDRPAGHALSLNAYDVQVLRRPRHMEG